MPSTVLSTVRPHLLHLIFTNKGDLFRTPETNFERQLSSVRHYRQYYHIISERAQGNPDFTSYFSAGHLRAQHALTRHGPGSQSVLCRTSLTGAAPAPWGYLIPVLDAQPLPSVVLLHYMLGLAVTKPRPSLRKRIVLERITCEILGD